MAAFLLVPALTSPLVAQTAQTGDRGDGPAGYFSADQVARGADRYRELCSECHTTSQFKGPDFEWRWRRQSAWELFREISTTMPESAPGSLDAETYTAIVAYLLSLNDYQQGADELSPTEEALSAIALGAGAAKAPSPP